MEIDPKMLERLLSLDDRRLENLIRELVQGSGVDPAVLGLDAGKLSDVRKALSNASPQDLENYRNLYERYRQNRRK